MDEDFVDRRPFAEPDSFSFCEPGVGDWVRRAQQHIGESWRGKVEEGRWTLIEGEAGQPGYQPGLYFEGWSVAPHRMDPPHRPAPFNYPCVARDSGRLPKGEDAGTAAECEASQSGPKGIAHTSPGPSSPHKE